MYKKILVPLDTSKRAEAILPHVEKLAQSFDAKLVFLRIINPFKVIIYEDGYVPPQETLKQKHKATIDIAKSYLSGVVGEFRDKQISAKSIVEEGPVVKTIIDVADREDADLVAMASHGRTGLSHVFYGSVAAGVLNRIDRPLLLIRADGKK